MRIMGKIVPALLLALVASACATTSMRAPVEDVPPGEYVLVEPQSDVFNAVRINPRAFTVRLGTQIHSGQHWVDGSGLLHMTDDDGPCAGQESIWNYDYANNRVTLNLVEDQCAARPTAFPDRMVYERR